MDYIALNNYADTTLREFYPSSKALTPIIMQEMHNMLFEEQADEATFSAALSAFRKEENSSFPPKAFDLQPYIKGIQKASRPADSSGSMLSFFADKVARMGWETAVDEMTWETATNEWISNMNTEVKYSCFTGWYQQYLMMLHSGTIVEALEFFIKHTDKEDKRALYKQLDMYRHLGNETCKKYYPYFRPKVAPKSIRTNPFTRVR